MDDLIKKLKSDPAFSEFVSFILSEIEELDTVDGLEKLTNKEAGEEAKVRSKAKAKLYEIVKPFVEYAEKKEPTEDDIKEAKGRVGL